MCKSLYAYFHCQTFSAEETCAAEALILHTSWCQDSPLSKSALRGYQAWWQPCLGRHLAPKSTCTSYRNVPTSSPPSEPLSAMLAGNRELVAGFTTYIPDELRHHSRCLSKQNAGPVPLPRPSLQETQVIHIGRLKMKIRLSP